MLSLPPWQLDMCINNCPAHTLGGGRGGTKCNMLDICNLMVAGSTPNLGMTAQQLSANCSHPPASVTKQYNLVPAKRAVMICSLQSEFGLGGKKQLPTRFMASVTCSLAAQNQNQLWNLCSCRVWDHLNSFFTHTHRHPIIL